MDVDETVDNLFCDNNISVGFVLLGVTLLICDVRGDGVDLIEDCVILL